MRKSFNFRQYVTDVAQSAFSTRYRLIPGSFEDFENIWLAETLPDHSRHVVVKKVHRRFAEEVSILHSLNHPNIVRLIEVFGTDDYLYLVLEHCEGGELFRIISDQGALAEQDCRNIIRQISSALSYLHLLSLSHGDIKPENVCCLTESLEIVKLIDFGSSAHSRGYTEVYAAPEIIDNKIPIDFQAADMYSLGMLLHAMVHGALPIGEVGSAEPESVDSLISSLLSTDPTMRPSAADLLVHPWVSSTQNSLRVFSARDLERLSAHAHRSPFGRALAAAAVKNLEISEIANLHNIFVSLDTDGDGKVSRSEFDAGLVLTRRKRQIGRTRTDSNFLQQAPNSDLIFNCVDSDNSGSIDYQEFLAAVSEEKIHTAVEVAGCFYDFISDSSVSALYAAIDSELELRDWIDSDDLDEVKKKLKFTGPTIAREKFIALFQKDPPLPRRNSSLKDEASFKAVGLFLRIRNRN